MKIETVVEKIERTTYVADDGKVFYDREACEQYEEWQRLKHIPFPEIYFVHAPDEHYSYGLVMLHTQDEFDKI